MTDALLTVQELSVSYSASTVVDSISLEILPGRCLGVIGESGAGKTQAFLAMMGLLPSQARITGAARLEGQDLLGPAAATLRGRRVAMIFQDPMTSLTPHMRIGDQIAEPLVTHQGLDWKEGRARAATLLEQVRMNDVPRRLRQYPHELSGGMRQRAMIAMALACDPKLLIADEPTTALDVSVQAQILALLRQIVAERGMALAVVTHDMGVIAALADDVAVMRGGRIVERGAVARILGSPEHAYTRDLLAATPRVETPGAGSVNRPAAAADAHSRLAIHDLRVHHRLRSGWLSRPQTLAAVDGVSLRVEAGEALGIVGESGCGKSTLARALLRLAPVTAGEIVWLGREIQDAGGEELRAVRSGIQIVFQDPFASLDPTMRVDDIVAEPLRALRPDMDAAQRASRVAEILTRVGLGPEYSGRRSRELSGGQCQRVAIARATARALRDDQARPRRQHPLREPQSRGRAQTLRTRARDVPRARGRAGARRGSVPASTASVHAHVVRGGAAARPGARTRAPGQACGAGRDSFGGRSSARMPFPYALRGRAAHVRRA